MVEGQFRVLVESNLAELTLPALCVVCAVVTDSSAHAASGRVHRRVEVACRGMFITVTFWNF